VEPAREPIRSIRLQVRGQREYLVHGRLVPAAKHLVDHLEPLVVIELDLLLVVQLVVLGIAVVRVVVVVRRIRRSLAI